MSPGVLEVSPTISHDIYPEFPLKLFAGISLELFMIPSRSSSKNCQLFFYQKIHKKSSGNYPLRNSLEIASRTALEKFL